MEGSFCISTTYPRHTKNNSTKEVIHMSKNEKKEDLKFPLIDGTMPHQISSPNFKDSGIKIEPPFVNEHGVVIGDSFYDSSNSPLNQWSKETDPSVMAGDEWVHPTNDIGWNTDENIDLVEKQKAPQGAPFMHPTKDVSKGSD